MKINWKAVRWTIMTYGGGMAAIIAFSCLPEYIIRPIMLVLIIGTASFALLVFLPFIVYDGFKRKFQENTLSEKPPHVPIEIKLHTEFNGDLVACSKWFCANWKKSGCEWSDLIMMQILLIERMNTLIASHTKHE